MAETGNKMILVADEDWNEFAHQVILMDSSVNTPASFFDEFYWGNIIGKTKNIFAQS